jgi:hypothetical protein
MLQDMWNKLKCAIGFHKWELIILSERKCLNCQKHQAKVHCPFNSDNFYWKTM